MTCVDAAIIKALVEHIGGDPDVVSQYSAGPGIKIDNNKIETAIDNYTLQYTSDNKLSLGYYPAENLASVHLFNHTFKVSNHDAQKLVMKTIPPRYSIMRLKRKDTGRMEDYMYIETLYSDAENEMIWLKVGGVGQVIIKFVQTPDNTEFTSAKQLLNAFVLPVDNDSTTGGIFYLERLGQTNFFEILNYIMDRLENKTMNETI